MMAYEDAELAEMMKGLDDLFDYLPSPCRFHRVDVPIDREAEEADRLQRQKNIIVFHLKEHIGETESIRNGKDHEGVTRILAHENRIDLSKMKIKRLGKYDPNHGLCRPLLIMFDTTIEAALALQNRGKFPQGVVVKLDRTPYQRQFF